MTVLLAAGAAAAGAAVVRFLTTVPVLPSLDSLMALTLRVARDVAPAREAAAAAAAVGFLALVDAAAVDPAAELAVDDVVVFLVVAAARVERAFSTMLLNMPLLLVAGLTGETGRAINDRAGDGAAGARSRGGRTRLLDDVGDRTWDGLGGGLVALAGSARGFFFGLSMCAISFSLSPPDISSLNGPVSGFEQNVRA